MRQFTSRIHFVPGLVFLVALLSPAAVSADAPSPARTFRFEETAEVLDSPRSFLEALADVQTRSAVGMHTQNIVHERPSEFGYLPAIANSPGAFSSNWTSDLFLVNPHPDGYLNVDFFFLPNGVDTVANAPVGRRVRLNALTGYITRDAVGAGLFNLNGVGALFYAIDRPSSTGAVYSISCWSYTATPGPLGGRFGSNTHGVGEFWSDELFDGWCVGARADGVARTNIGIVNRGLTALDIQVQVVTNNGSSTRTITVPAAGFVHTSLGAPFQFQSGIILFSALEANTGWIAYMTVVDNVTNDSNFQYTTGW